MRATVTFGLAVLLLASVAVAAEVKSGLQPGASVGAFDVEKVAGAVNDNVEVGKNLCYRCMLGSKPVVVVFARKADQNLGMLVKELDKAVAKNADQKLSSFVNLIGSDDASSLKTEAKAFASTNKVENVALVVPHETKNGPADYNISPAAEVTVLVYRKGKVEANHAFAPGELNKAAIATIISDAEKMLK